MPDYKIRLSDPRISEDDIGAVVKVLRSGHVTQGEYVEAFQQAFLDWNNFQGAQAMMVNSGSSANLLAAGHLATITGGAGGEVIMPALTWPTTVHPFTYHGFKPVFVDVGADLTTDPDEVLDAITPQTVGIVAVHLLGNPCNMREIARIADDHGLWLMEDCCEALGASVGDHNVGKWADVATYSFYFSHHLSTIEGGMMVWRGGDEGPLAWREHGWARKQPSQSMHAARHPDLDPRWLFTASGYNLRSTEINAILGLRGLERIRDSQTHRLAIASTYRDCFSRTTPDIMAGVAHGTPNPFSFPVLVGQSKINGRILVQHLEANDIEARPIMSGDITRHPYFAARTDMYSVRAPLTWTRNAHWNGCLLPCHDNMTKDDARHVAGIVIDHIMKEGKTLGVER